MSKKRNNTLFSNRQLSERTGIKYDVLRMDGRIKDEEKPLIIGEIEEDLNKLLDDNYAIIYIGNSDAEDFQKRALLRDFLEHIEADVDFLPCDLDLLIDDFLKH